MRGGQSPPYFVRTRRAPRPKARLRRFAAAHCHRHALRAPSATSAHQALHRRSASSRSDPTSRAEWECARSDHPHGQPSSGCRAKSESSGRAAVAAGEEQNARSTAPFKPSRQTLLAKLLIRRPQIRQPVLTARSNELLRPAASSRPRSAATITWMLNDECGHSARSFRPYPTMLGALYNYLATALVGPTPMPLRLQAYGL